jgi:hypothetical protein
MDNLGNLFSFLASDPTSVQQKRFFVFSLCSFGSASNLHTECRELPVFHVIWVRTGSASTSTLSHENIRLFPYYHTYKKINKSFFILNHH